ncbi:hypothetical protein ACLOJK_003376 [Asimina triloba]
MSVCVNGINWAGPLDLWALYSPIYTCSITNRWASCNWKTVGAWKSEHSHGTCECCRGGSESGRRSGLEKTPFVFPRYHRQIPCGSGVSKAPAPRTPLPSSLKPSPFSPPSGSPRIPEDLRSFHGRRSRFSLLHSRRDLRQDRRIRRRSCSEDLLIPELLSSLRRKQQQSVAAAASPLRSSAFGIRAFLRYPRVHFSVSRGSDSLDAFVCVLICIGKLRVVGVRRIYSVEMEIGYFLFSCLVQLGQLRAAKMEIWPNVLLIWRIGLVAISMMNCAVIHEGRLTENLDFELARECCELPMTLLAESLVMELQMMLLSES